MPLTEKEQLQAVISEGRALLKDMTKERKRMERILKETETHIDEYSAKNVEAILTEAAHTAVEQLVKVVGLKQRELEDSVVKAVQELTNTIMYGNKQGRGVNILEEALKVQHND